MIKNAIDIALTRALPDVDVNARTFRQCIAELFQEAVSKQKCSPLTKNDVEQPGDSAVSSPNPVLSDFGRKRPRGPAIGGWTKLESSSSESDLDQKKKPLKQAKPLVSAEKDWIMPVIPEAWILCNSVFRFGLKEWFVMASK